MVSETTDMSTSDLHESSSQLVIPTSLTPGDVYFIAENSMVVCMSQAGASQLSPILTSAYLPQAGSPSDASSSPVGIPTSYYIPGPVPAGYYTTSDNPYSTLYVNPGDEYLGSASSPMLCTPDGQCYSPALDYVVLDNGMMSPADLINGTNVDYDYYGTSYPMPSEFEPSISSEDSSNIVQESVLSNESQGHDMNTITVMQNGYADSVASENSMKQPRANLKSRGMFYSNSPPTVTMKKATVRYHLNQSFRNGHWANNVIFKAKEREGALLETQNHVEDLDEKGAVSLDVVMENFPDFTKLGVTLDELKSAIKDADNMVLIEDNYLTYKVMGRIVFSGMPTSLNHDHSQNEEKRFDFDSSHIGAMFDHFVRSKIGEDDARELDVRPDLHAVMITSRTFPLSKMEKIFKIFCDYAYQSIHQPENDCCTDGLSLKNISLRKVPISDNVVTIEDIGPTNNNEESCQNAYYPTGEEELVTNEGDETSEMYLDRNIYPTTTTQPPNQLIATISNLGLSSTAYEFPAPAPHLTPQTAWSRPVYMEQPIMKLPNNRHPNFPPGPAYRNGAGSRGSRAPNSGGHSKVSSLSAGISLQSQRMDRTLPPRFQRGNMGQQPNYSPGSNDVIIYNYPPHAAIANARSTNPNYGNGFYHAPVTGSSYNENSQGYVSNSSSNARRGHGSNSESRPNPNDANSRNGIQTSGGRSGYSSSESRRGRPNGYSGSNGSRGGRRGGNSSGHYNDRFHHSSKYSDYNTNSAKNTHSEPPAAPNFGEKDFPSLPVTDATKTSSHSISASSTNTISENEQVNVTVWGTVTKTTPKPAPNPIITPPETTVIKNSTSTKSPTKNLAKDNVDTGTSTAPTFQNAWSQNTTPTSAKPCEEIISGNNNSVAEPSTTQQNNKCTSYADVLKSAGQPTSQSSAASPTEHESTYPTDTAVVSANSIGPSESGVGQQVCSNDSSPVQVSVMNGTDTEQQRVGFPSSSRGGGVSSRGNSSRGCRTSGSSRGGRK